MCYSNLQTGGTPVTKLDSVERLALDFELKIGLHLAPFERELLRAALTEMRDLSRREALREAAKTIGSTIFFRAIDEVETDCYRLLQQIVAHLERLAVEEGTK
jgi:hypothetical protein